MAHEHCSAVAGSVDAGKSSLVGVLTHGIDGRPLLDNGCGSARMNVFQHKHEIETGRTSSLSQQMLGYDEEGALAKPRSCLSNRATSPVKDCQLA